MNVEDSEFKFSQLRRHLTLSQAASTRCIGDNKEKLSTNIYNEYASDFCHDRKSAFMLPVGGPGVVNLFL